MLDGFVIKGNVLEQAPTKSSNVKAHTLKRSYSTILVSVSVHLVLVVILFFVAEKQHPKLNKVTPKAIKSYLYKMPNKKVVDKQEEAKPKQIKENIIEKQVGFKQEIVEKIIIEQEKKPENNVHDKTMTSKSSSESLSTTVDHKIQKSVKATFSPYKQLDNLRYSINEKMMAQEVSKRQQFRSPSVMHGEQIPVPHSNVQLTPEQEREQQTTKMSNDISITKYDNGICTIEREQFLGSPVEGSSSAFSCGESKFNKSFREHMKKVRDKVMPIKNK